MGGSCALTTLLVLTVITVTRGQTQYYDILQGLQQLFRPYQSNENINLFNGATRATHKQTNRQESKKKTVENRHQTEERRTRKPPPMYQYDYVFATSEKPSQKTTKTNNVNRVKTTTTTEASYFNNDGNRGTTQNVFSNNFNITRPVTENVFEDVNHRETFAVNNQPRPTNLISNGTSLDNNNNFAGNTSNRPQNDQNGGNSNVNINNRGTQNTNNNTNFSTLPENNRNNNSFLNTDNNSGFNNFSNTGVGFNNTGTTNNNNRENSSFNTNKNNTENSNSNSTNNFNQGNNFGGLNYSETSLNNRPGVQPSPVDVGLSPITNRPASNNNNFGAFKGTSDTSSVTLSDQPDQETVVLIGPDEDDMTELQKKKYAEQAEKMCDYYKSSTVKKAVAFSLVLSPEPEEIKVSDCAPINLPLVIGGSVASIREFPHMALVGWKQINNTGYSWKCGGSLISDRYVLTAGHCTYQGHDLNVASGPPQVVQLGSSYLNDPGALVVKISAVIRHPKYKPPLVYHDIALIKMASKVKFSEVIRPACLGVPPSTGRSVIATGWGKSEFTGHVHVQLRSVSLSVWDMQECKDIWGRLRRFPNGVTPDSHMCAGDKEGLGHDTCQGDSGGPAQIQDGCLWRVVAVTSFGKSCGIPDTPALYAVIPHAFIAAQVFEESS